ncbi:hypothetical protein CWATWH0402_4112 [Crocosphaera watsonii WH 0402]|uniref:Uncharacterized protein n=1 Tax=Crocosphaera watsonii WH 0402 TaxID=1284629 RepID=T2JJJ0_CROWT|nr:hypothetical protein CWATWH0402_4112 [Crocosphaera watsonii WH 0402]
MPLKSAPNNFSTSAELLVGANINTQTSFDVATQTQGNRI